MLCNVVFLNKSIYTWNLRSTTCCESSQKLKKRKKKKKPSGQTNRSLYLYSCLFPQTSELLILSLANSSNIGTRNISRAWKDIYIYHNYPVRANLKVWSRKIHVRPWTSVHPTRLASAPVNWVILTTPNILMTLNPKKNICTGLQKYGDLDRGHENEVNSYNTRLHILLSCFLSFLC